MRQPGLISILVFAVSSTLVAQNPPPPQTARQALIEMFMGKGENDFTKHLPDAARVALIHKGDTPETSMLLRISGGARSLITQGGNAETFDSGPNILVVENSNNHERVEIAVEHDSLSGEEDEIELSVHPYKDGQPDWLPIVPRLIFTLKEEKDVWRVSELTVAAHVPLTDGDYLHGLRKQQDESLESAAQMRVNMTVQAETTYAANHSSVGYTCMLANLYPNAEGDESQHSTPAFAQEEWNGYRYALSGCSGTPSLKYRLTAVPLDADSEMKAFCVDQSGTMKSVAAAESSSCFSHGKVVGVATVPAAE